MGLVCIVLGVAGLFLPLLPGTLLLAIGVFLLAAQLPFFARIICWFQRKFPKLERYILQLRESLHRDWHPPPCPPEE